MRGKNDMWYLYDKKAIKSVDIKKLEQRVKKKGLHWEKLL